jgi:hypothetical protein
MPLTGLTSLGSLAALPNLSASSGSTATQPTAATTPAAGPSWLTGELAQVATILIGIVFIVAGLFSFKSVRDTGATVVKTAAVAAV